MTDNQFDVPQGGSDPISGEKKIPVVEIFGPTIEGEGSLAGMQTFFIRFGLCDYKCKKCDSWHAVDPKLVKAFASYMTQEEIFWALQNQAIASNTAHIKNVTFSGGNPAIHNLRELVHLLKADGWRIYVETQGTKSPDWLNLVDHIVVSPKSPGMGETFKHTVFIDFMRKYAFQGVPMTVKIVVFSAQDLEFAAAVAELCTTTLAMYRSFNLTRDFYLSLGNPYPPVFQAVQSNFDGTLELHQSEDLNLTLDNSKKTLVEKLLQTYNVLSEEILKDSRLSFAKFLPQLHVLVWGNETGR